MHFSQSWNRSQESKEGFFGPAQPQRIRRHKVDETKLKELAAHFREVLVTGARQVQTGLIIHAGELCYRPHPQIIALPWNLLPGGERKRKG